MNNNTETANKNNNNVKKNSANGDVKTSAVNSVAENQGNLCQGISSECER